MPDARFSSIAERAQRMDGFAQTLEPVSTAGRFKIMQDISDGVVKMTQNGGAWTPLGSGGGGGGTLNGDYQNGPVGNTILMTDALGPITLSSAITTGPILAITTTTLPAAVAGAITAISIDMGSLGTAATPATVALPAISVTGAYSSVAKAAGAGLVQISSAYRNATALSVKLKNKQAATGSAVAIGWDTTNYEGSIAASILTGQTHVLTIDAQTNVDGATNNVEVVGCRILLPSGTNTATSGVSVGSIAKAGRYLLGAFTAPTTLAGTFVGCEIDCTTNVAAGTGQAVIGARFQITNSSNVATSGVTITSTQTGSTSAAVNIALTPASGAPSGVIVSMGASIAKTGVTDGSAFLANLLGFASCGLCVIASVSNTSYGQNALQIRREMTTSTNMSEGTAFVDIINTSTYNGGTTTISQSFTHSAMLATIAGATWTWSGNLIHAQSAPTRSSGTVSLTGACLRLTHAPTGTISTDTTSLLVGTTIAKSGTTVSFTSTATLTGSLTMLSLDASGATAGAQTVLGLQVSTPATSSGVGVQVFAKHTAGIAFQLGYGTTTLSGDTTGISLNLATSVTPGSNAVVGANIAIGASTSTSSAGVFVTATGTSTPGFVVQNQSTSALSNTALIQAGSMLGVERSGTWSGGGTDSSIYCHVVTFAQTTAASTWSGSLFVLSNGLNCATAGTVTDSSTTLNVLHGPSCTVTGTHVMSGTVVKIRHEPSNAAGSAITDTTLGLLINMAPTTASAVTGQTTIMQSNTSSSGAAANFVWNSTAGTNGITNNAVVNIYTNQNGNSGTLTLLSIGSRTANLTVNAAKTLTGALIDVSTNVLLGASTSVVVGLDVRISSYATFANASKGASINRGGSPDASANYTGNVLYVANDLLDGFSGTATENGIVAYILHRTTSLSGGTFTDTTTGLKVEMIPKASAAVIGAQFTMASNATGAAVSIAHSGTNANQLVFTSVADGTGAHLQGPTGGTFLIRAGTTAVTTGRDIQIKAGPGNGGTSAGGNVLLSGGVPVSTGSTGYVLSTTAFGETSIAGGNTGATTVTIDVSLGNSFTYTSTGNTTWAFSNAPAAGYVYSLMLTLTNGGAFTQNWGSVKWPGGAPPTLTVSGVDLLVFSTIDGGTTWRGVLAQSDSR